jgi:hypothetical protein
MLMWPARNTAQQHGSRMQLFCSMCPSPYGAAGSNQPGPSGICATLQVLCSISIIAITSNRITHPGLGTQKRCYLSSDPHNTSPCSFAYAAAGISLGIAVLAGCLRVSH